MKSSLNILFLLTMLCTSSLFGQEYFMQNETIFTCEGMFYDSGGPDVNYGDSEVITMTFCAEDFSSCIGLNFETYDIEAGFDQLLFFAGATNVAPLIGTLEGNGTDFSVTSTDFCITIQFVSDVVVNLPGWEAEIFCGACPTCDDGIMNGFEAGIDCGGDCEACPCADAQIEQLPVNIDGTTCGMGNSFDFNNACSSLAINGQDITYEYIAEESTCINFELSNLPPTTSGLTVTSGCPDDLSSQCLLSLQSFGEDVSGIVNMEEGESYFITIGSDGFGAPCIDFSLLISDDCPPLDPSDCFGAITVCQDLYEETAAPQGSGSFPNEFSPGSCNFSETNSYWYSFTVQESGDLSFIIEPNDNDDDYDWALFHITEFGCENIPFEPDMEVSCNSWGVVGENGPTGISSADGGVGNSNGPGDLNGPPFNADLPVEEGQTYALVVMNWSNSQVGYNLNFGNSTANIFDDTPPEIEEIILGCSSSEIEVIFSEPVLCETLISDNFTLNGFNGEVFITAASSEDCSIGASVSNSVTIELSEGLISGDYTLSANGISDVVDPCGNPVQSEFEFAALGGFFVDPIVNQPCLDGEGSIDVSNFEGGLAPVIWSIDGSEDEDGIFENLEDANYSIVLEDATGCTINLDIPIQNQGIEMDIQGDFIQCALITELQVETNEATESLDWSSPPELNIEEIDGNSFLATASQAGEYELTAIASNDNCSAEQTLNLSLAEELQIEVEIDDACAAGEGAITAEVISGGLAPYTFDLDEDSNNNGSFTGLDVGQYILEVMDNSACFFSGNYEVPLGTLELDLGADLELCELSTELTAEVDEGQITWSAPPEVEISDLNSTEISITTTQADEYEIEALIETELCSASDVITITFSEPISFDVLSEDVSCHGLCDGSITLQTFPEDLEASIDGGISTGNDLEFEDLCAGSYQVLVSNDLGCFQEQTIQLSEPPEITAAFDANPQPSQLPNSTINFENESENYSGSIWNFGLEGASSFEDSPSFTYPDNIGAEYLTTLTVFNEFGCMDSISRNIIIEDDLEVFIPNAFTPDNDGLNDYFVPVLSGSVSVYAFQIYDRWGQLVFESENPGEPWLGNVVDGEYYARPGVYVWILEVGQNEVEAKSLNGTVTLMR